MCTDFLLLAGDASVVNGRSMEFGSDLKSELLIGGRGTEKMSPTPDLKDGLRWTARYGYVGMNAYGKKIITDGMNEVGLSIGALWLPGTRYQRTVSNPSKALVVDLFTSWVLGTCATVDEVKDRLNRGEVEVWGDLVLEKEMPLHFPIHDEAGRSIVIEFIDGEIQIHDNPVAVLTNDPPFPWQITNIENYVGLSNTDAEPIEIGLKRFKQTGHGSGMRGLPGDSTPPSRFIRTVFQKHFAERPKTGEEACNLALHLLNTVDIPKGTSASRPKEGKAPEYDYTQWIVLKALTQKVFNFRTYDNPTIMQVDLKKLDLSVPGETPHPLPAQPVSIDITPVLSRATES
ncbi:linear amide C-N hydrolase [Inquilinus sp. CA228]|uniref:linear amide C-N hydrolase n=1 Tax=Inquilinus sp. CA228 TaxID=3455609 RepID=UPI003F8D5344